MASFRQGLGVEVRLAVQLGDSFRDLVGMLLFFMGVFKELFCDRLGMNSAGHIVVAFITQNADQFGGQSLVEDANHRLPVCAIVFRDSAVLHVQPGAATYFLNV